MRMAAGARTWLRSLLFLIPWPLFVAMAWFMFHNQTVHGITLNGDHGTYVGDRTCLAPYDITLFHASNEYGGDEVADSAYEKAHCYSAGHKSFAVGAAAGVAGVWSWAYAVVLHERRRREET
jgi:hypothetical protein